MICKEIKIEACGGDARLSCCLHEQYPKLPGSKKRPCIVICPGGAYERVSDREADNVAAKCLGFGYHTAVLRYAVAPHRFPTALCQLAKALAFLREQAAEWHIDPDQIAVMGFSAGGHLAASLGNFWNSPFLKKQLAGETEAGKEPAVLAERIRPNAQILCYPVISGIKSPHEGSFRNLIGPGPEAWFLERCRELSMEKCVGPDTPPTFLWHCLPDDTVPAVNSLLMAEALWKEQIPVELHLYGTGGHALGTADALSLSVDGRGVQPECANWMELCHTWLKHIWKEAV